MKQRRRAVLQLRHVLGVLRNERPVGHVSAELADRAEQVVKRTAVAIEPEADQELLDLLEDARRAIADLRARSGDQ